MNRIPPIFRFTAAVALSAGALLGGPAHAANAATTATAVFAGGCFWCTEADFEKLPGVVEAVSGYMGGKVPNPTYQAVSAGHTGHTEAVRVTYDPTKVSYSQLVEFFWKTIDPSEKDRQFCDIGDQYRSGIYWGNEAERQIVTASRDALQKTGRFKTIYTETLPATTFYLAEDYHQDYYKKNSVRYSYYRLSCGRDAQLKRVWK
jgi:peptide-methionine (S)-S-oxide reductase